MSAAEVVRFSFVRGAKPSNETGLKNTIKLAYRTVLDDGSKHLKHILIRQAVSLNRAREGDRLLVLYRSGPHDTTSACGSAHFSGWKELTETRVFEATKTLES